MVPAAPTESRRSLLGRALMLQYLTIGYNVAEGVIAVTAGLVASSIALVGFGFDSGIEVVASTIIVWRFRKELAGARGAESGEARASKAIGLTFLLLAGYIAIEAGGSLLAGEVPSASPAGIALAAASLIVMPLLAVKKRRLARRLHSGAAIAESNQTLACTALSGILLFGLAANAVAGWWWADSFAALLMVPLLAREGVEAYKGRLCCDVPHTEGGSERDPEGRRSGSVPIALAPLVCAVCGCGNCRDGCSHAVPDWCRCPHCVRGLRAAPDTATRTHG